VLLEPGELRRAAPIYFAYHPWIEPVSQMALAPIVKGTFLMGSPDTEPQRGADEGPRHRVTLSHDFWMGIHPVTQGQYEAVMGKNPSDFRGENRPVENVSWEEAAAFCERLTEQAAATELLPEGYVFRLPTEAEWEYCCRAGTDSATAFGDRLSSDQANFDGNFPYGGAEKGPYLEQTSDVGSYPPNPWGLSDMHGNVWEWCLDAAEWEANFGVRTDTYVDGVEDPLCQVGRIRVNRGGSWDVGGRICRSAYRLARVPGDRYDALGFRVCLARSPAGSSPGRSVTESGSHVPPERSRAGTSSRSESRRARKDES
jgi:eukaryotic-like serine/threonine-protein kinase